MADDIHTAGDPAGGADGMAVGAVRADGPGRVIAGAMSGTSADGVAVALVHITGRGLQMTARLLHHVHHPYDPWIRQAIFRMREAGSVDLASLARAGREISLAYAGAVRDALAQASLSASDLTAVAAHGQTLFHDPPNTIQWLDPALLAAEVGCIVVSDFRRADCAAGGQGAPLAPFGDYILFRHPLKNRVCLNIGGIANITVIPAGATHDAESSQRSVATGPGGLAKGLAAFDTGPGNCISDWLMRTREPSGPGFDKGGRRALRGIISRGLVSRVMSNPYFEAAPPKSTDGPDMIRLFDRAVQEAEAVTGPISTDDRLAEACCLTAVAIEHAIGLVTGWRRGDFEMIASGGGVWNEAIMTGLTELLGKGAVRTSDAFGVPPDAKEALVFALLGAASLDGIPSNVPAATGARRAAVLGSITPRP